MSSINIRRAIENIRSGTSAYTPVIELIVNAVQAVRAVRPTGGTVTVRVLRSAQPDLIETTSTVDGFVVEDDGIGFDQVHRDAFDTLYTAMKAADGGKGFGRFTCLKYFEHLLVDSVFRDAGGLRSRRFAMGVDTDIITDEDIGPAPADATTGSTVTIRGAKSVKIQDRTIEPIARVLVERLLPYFIDQGPPCPRITIVDVDGATIVLNDYLTSVNRKIAELDVLEPCIDVAAGDKLERFKVRVFKFYAPRGARSKIALVAHRREVTDTTIQSLIPEFADEFSDRADPVADPYGRNFIVKAYVFGDYLDDNVSLERGAFSFPREGDLMAGVSQADIERCAAEVARGAMGADIVERTQRKSRIIEDYVAHRAPWHRALSREADFSSLPMRPSPQDIELHLQTAKFQNEQLTRAQVRKILEDGDTDAMGAQVAAIVSSISQTAKNDLTHYASMRRCVLDLLGKALEHGDGGRYGTEGDVHDIIMPRRSDSETLPYDDHNLWILDERLNFTEYVASDMPLAGGRGERGDIMVFNRRMAFRGENQPGNPITVFVFKRPQRGDFADPSSEEDPVEQVIRYVNKIREGRFSTPKGREILVTRDTPFYGYVVCDLPAKVRKWLNEVKNFTPMPDGLGYFQWFGNIRLYMEVLSWTKVHADADMRNKIFFEKLGI